MSPDAPPRIVTEVPGPRSRELAGRLARVECPEVTYLEVAPIFWESAQGSHVIDVDGNRYVDLVAGFGVAALGHAHPSLQEAAARQAALLPHAMGDVYPARVKVELLEALERVLPADLGSAILSCSGSDAVESALKTALRATGRAGVVAFEGAYHGLGLGSLDATHAARFREPFEARLAHETRFVPYGAADAVRSAVRAGDVGAILVEPIQGRGGIRVPPRGFLRELRDIADREGLLLIADEVYTGLGRTGHWLGCDEEAVVPDVVALGKALGGGFPISACAGRRQVMERWGASRGEAIHTSTHLGNPLGCAMALEVLRRLEADDLPRRAAVLGARALERLEKELGRVRGVVDVRGRGLLLGVELDSAERAERVVREGLRSGWILLPEGRDARVLALSPPLNIPEALLDAALDWLVEQLGK
jgi:4-aminobutyrate aminotransferase/(S)-3-amino-2-methylpropionate transaminase